MKKEARITIWCLPDTKEIILWILRACVTTVICLRNFSLNCKKVMGECWVPLLQFYQSRYWKELCTVKNRIMKLPFWMRVTGRAGSIYKASYYRSFNVAHGIMASGRIFIQTVLTPINILCCKMLRQSYRLHESADRRQFLFTNNQLKKEWRNVSCTCRQVRKR